ncbi:MAG TPA: CheR family methyltransferase [Prolixibacteraceae bacterium]|nr:CheR family methyltransferase [Prolixibacteraceae bacterium]
MEFKQLSDELFLQLGKMITERYGIKMPPDKKIMFQARLQRRLRELDIHSFDDYVLKLLSDQGESSEFSLLADYISTNKTEFFRENDHFNFMTNQFLPDFMNKGQHQPHLKIWSAGCSSGQEAYSIGITLEEFMRMKRVMFDYSIVATDISVRMLKSAKDAIYPMSQVDNLTLDIKLLYFLKSKSMKDPKVRLVNAIREKVRVAYLNLMDDSYPLNVLFDVVFLRNTLIYFSHEIQMKVLTKVLGSLNTGGYLFIGHSESLINMRLPIQSIAPSVYVKTNDTNL